MMGNYIKDLIELTENNTFKLNKRYFSLNDVIKKAINMIGPVS
jgi:hypothetical protein